MFGIYSLLIRLYTGLIYLASPFSSKASRWVQGRKQFPVFTEPKGVRWWFHCASLGEFEQARPVIEAIKQQRPESEIMLSFFSPSGYEIRKNYPFADKVFYLPADLPSSMQRLVRQMKPSAFFLVKYEFWLNLLHVLQKEKVSCYLFSGIFRKGHWLFSPAGFLAVKLLQGFECIWVQDSQSLERLTQAGFRNAFLGGDTRFDRVRELPLQAFAEREKIRAHAREKKILVAGSVWPAEIKHLLDFVAKADFASHWMLIIAPHEPKPELIHGLQKSFGVYAKTGLWSKRELSNDVLIIDSIGELGKIYGTADVALVGGGFGKGIHNILEPAVYGIPVLFGPNHRKALEAAGLISSGGAFAYQNGDDLCRQLLELHQNSIILQRSGEAAASFVAQRFGATSAVLRKVIA
jgi:3-deoxy-D-manno-octulosonic-acid transferase